MVPPAPRVDVRLGAPGEALSLGPLPALVDTGADVCIVPDRHLAARNLPIDDERYLRPYGGGCRRVRFYTLDIGIGPVRLPAVEAVADDVETEVILGRNALNKLFIALDGPGLMLDIREY